MLTDMNTTILVEAGLTDAQAAAYTFLVENSPISPPALAACIEESRTNAYKVLEQLEELGLAQKDESEKKIKYWAKNPSALLQSVKQAEEEAELRRKKLETSLPSLVHDFMKHNEQPGVRFYQGKDALVSIHEDQLLTGKEVLYIRSSEDVHSLQLENLHSIRNKFPEKGIKRKVIIQDELLYPIKATDRMPVDESDKLMLLERTWIKKSDYTSPVEWSTYGNKTAIISFGNETIGMIIESPQIAASFRQIFELLSNSINRLEDYKKLPKEALYTKIPESAK